jgi:hypothetical protein
LKELVTLVLTNVPNVTQPSLNVLNVVMLTEDHSTNVHVKMDIMMMVITPVVTLVAISV